MRILDVSPKVVLPANTGSRVRMWNLLRSLSRRHEVRQFSQQRAGSGRRERINEVWVTKSYCEIQYSDPMIRLLANLAEAPRVAAPPLRGAGLHVSRPAHLDSLLEWADVIVVEFPWQFSYLHRRRNGKPVVLATHNVEADRFASVVLAEGRRSARHPWARVIERVEQRAVCNADLVLAVSDDDRTGLIRRYGVPPDRVAVVPNGVDTATFVPVDSSARTVAKRRLGLPERPTVLYTGSNTAPNRAGLEWVRRLAKRSPHLSFVVVGELSAGLTDEPFFAPGVVNEMAPYLQAADFAICPIEFGGGTKIKLLEALGAGLPTLAFLEATQGLRVEDGEHLLVVPKDETAIIAIFEKLVADRALAERLGRSGRDWVCANHDWQAIASELEFLLSSLVQSGSAAGRSGTEMAGVQE